MNKWSSILRVALASSLIAASGSAFAAYISGSTGLDGALTPSQNLTINLPADGVLNYTTVNIPTGVTVTFNKNAANTPVTILATGDVTIAGTIDVSATSLDITSGGLGGPGGYNGGNAGSAGGVVSSWVNGYTGLNVGRAGVGPGGGAPGSVHVPSAYTSSVPADVAAGGGGAYGTAPPAASGSCPTTPGVAYGNAALIPLIGGSGGGGGAGGTGVPGSGGGGGGGAILIASSGTIYVNGSILANGGISLSPGSTLTRGVYGGGGSGGAIRLIASTVNGNGTISAAGGTSLAELVSATGYFICTSQANGSQQGGAGRIRIDADNLIRTAATTPAWSRGAPSLVSVPGLPTLRIDTVGGITVPAQPTGSGDVALPTGFTNPVTVTFVTSGITVGSLIKLTVTPAQGLASSVTTTQGTTGTISSATASVTTNLLYGANTLQASVTYTVVASIGDAMGVYAQGERVEKVTLTSTLGNQQSTVTLTTVSGKEYVVPSSVLALAVLPG